MLTRNGRRLRPNGPAAGFHARRARPGSIRTALAARAAREPFERARRPGRARRATCVGANPKTSLKMHQLDSSEPPRLPSPPRSAAEAPPSLPLFFLFFPARPLHSSRPSSATRWGARARRPSARAPSDRLWIDSCVVFARLPIAEFPSRQAWAPADPRPPSPWPLPVAPRVARPRARARPLREGRLGGRAGRAPARTAVTHSPRCSTRRGRSPRRSNCRAKARRRNFRSAGGEARGFPTDGGARALRTRAPGAARSCGRLGGRARRPFLLPLSRSLRFRPYRRRDGGRAARVSANGRGEKTRRTFDALWTRLEASRSPRGLGGRSRWKAPRLSRLAPVARWEARGGGEPGAVVHGCDGRGRRRRGARAETSLESAGASRGGGTRFVRKGSLRERGPGGAGEGSGILPSGTVRRPGDRVATKGGRARQGRPGGRTGTAPAPARVGVAKPIGRRADLWRTADRCGRDRRLGSKRARRGGAGARTLRPGGAEKRARGANERGSAEAAEAAAARARAQARGGAARSGTVIPPPFVGRWPRGNGCWRTEKSRRARDCDFLQTKPAKRRGGIGEGGGMEEKKKKKRQGGIDAAREAARKEAGCVEREEEGRRERRDGGGSGMWEGGGMKKKVKKGGKGEKKTAKHRATLFCSLFHQTLRAIVPSTQT